MESISQSTIQHEATEKLVNALNSLNIDSKADYLHYLILDHVNTSSNRSIHSYVKATDNLRKAVIPKDKYNFKELDKEWGKVYLPNKSEILICISDLGLNSRLSEELLTNFIMNNITVYEQ